MLFAAFRICFQLKHNGEKIIQNISKAGIQLIVRISSGFVAAALDRTNDRPFFFTTNAFC